jgi:radical SAM superfamily enzyme YgiQ (UPF0313 family)
MTKELDALLIFPPPSAYMPKDAWGGYLLGLSPPVGLLYLAGYLLSRGYRVEVLDGAVMSVRGRSLKQAIRECQPRLVGLSCVTMNAYNTLHVAEYVRSVHPEAAIIAGGPHPSFCYEEMLASGHIDVAARFEGEITIGELAEYYLGRAGADAHRLGLSDISGIAYKQEGEIMLTPARQPVADLDQFPFPARQLMALEEYRVPGIILTGRGCPFGCIFCAAGPLSGRRYRKHSIERVIAEIQECVQVYGLRFLFLADDCFTADRQRAAAICERMMELPTQFQWVCEGRVDTVNRDLLAKMRAAGCIAIQYGVESGSQMILDHINKRTTVEQIQEAVRWAVELGMKAECSLQIGHPEDTPETIRQTLEFARKLRTLSTFPGQVKTDFGITTPLPGTFLRDHAAELGVEILTNDWDRYTFIDPVINTRHLQAEQLGCYVFETMFDMMGQPQPSFWKETCHVEAAA